MVDFSRYLKVKVDPTMPPDQMRIEQDGKVLATIINLKNELSIEALKANLFYADAQKQKAYIAHTEALINYHLALDALNQAIVKKHNNG